MFFLSWDESGCLSAWSLTHVLHGYLWNLVWAFSSDNYLPWLNLLLFVLFELLWELLENYPGSPTNAAWRWLGYTAGTYSGDTVQNSITDVMLAVFGWALIQIVAEYTLSTTALVALIGIAFVIFVIFLVLFRIEKRLILDHQSVDPAKPAPTAEPAESVDATNGDKTRPRLDLKI